MGRKLLRWNRGPWTEKQAPWASWSPWNAEGSLGFLLEEAKSLVRLTLATCLTCQTSFHPHSCHSLSISDTGTISESQGLSLPLVL